MRYFLFISLLSLLSPKLINADLLNSKCEDYTTKDSCIFHIYCGWCNNTNNYPNNYSNNSFTCDKIGICATTENCYTNEYSMCMNFTLFFKIIIIFILICVTFTILLTISNILKRTNIHEIVKNVILFLVASIIIVPIVVLYYYSPTYFIYLFIGDIALCVLIWILYGGKMVVYNNNSYMNQYTPINQIAADGEESSSVSIN